MVRDAAACARIKHLGKYEIGKTLGEGNFGKVKYARNVNTGNEFAIKILDKRRIRSLKIDDQIKREIGTLKLLRHPNVIRLHEVLASKSKIYMVLEYAMGGELFDKIALNGKFRENDGRKLFQQLIDAISYCHEKGVYHRDLKPENVLVDMEGCIKISDFGLSALHQHIGNDGMLHTTCGSPNYVAPEVLKNRGYDGALSDIWSCGVILYVVLTGYLPFDDRNLAVLYQKIFNGNVQIPKRLSPGAKNMIKKMLDPDPNTRMKMDEIKSDDWFQQDYIPAIPEDENGIYYYHDDTFSIDEQNDSDSKGSFMPNKINAFQLIGMSSCLDLSGLFEKDHVSERKVVFASNHCSKELPERIKCISVDNGFEVTKRNKKLKIMQRYTGSSNPCGLFSASAEVFEISQFVSVVEISKFHGDSPLYREFCTKLSNELGMLKSTVT